MGIQKENAAAKNVLVNKMESEEEKGLGGRKLVKMDTEELLKHIEGADGEASQAKKKRNKNKNKM